MSDGVYTIKIDEDSVFAELTIDKTKIPAGLATELVAKFTTLVAEAGAQVVVSAGEGAILVMAW